MTEALKVLLTDKLKANIDLDLLCSRIEKLYINTDTKGGIYGLLITNATFAYQGTITDKLCLVKFGRADNYDTRFSQFKFNYNILFQVNGDNNMEKWLKDNLPSNFKKAYWEKAKVLTIKQNLKLPESSNPGPTEWRIISRDLLEQIRQLNLTNLNYQTKFTTMLKGIEPETIPAGSLELHWGDFTKKNAVDVVYL